jgi:hypothetical protein
MKLFRADQIRLSFLAAIAGMILCSTIANGAIAPEATFLNRITQGVSTPVRMAADQFSNIYVADPRGGGILKYDHAGNFLTSFPAKGPRGVAITPAGDLVVTRGDSASVLNSTTGAEKFKLGIGVGQFKQATGVAVDDTGQIYVVDSLDNCVQVFTRSGTAVSIAAAASGKPANSFGTSGSLAGQFTLPTGITFEKLSKQLAVVDTLSAKVQFFTTSGVFQKTLGSSGVGPLKFTNPRGVAFEYTKGATPALSRIYVVDTFQSEIQVIDPAGTGTFLSTIGGYGFSAGQLVAPSDLLFDEITSRLIVANGLGDLTLYGINVTVLQTPDITPPLLTLNQPPATTSTDSVILSGLVETEALLTITTNTGAVAGPINTAQQSPTSSFWSVRVSGLAPGVNLITLLSQDNAANPTLINTSITYDPTAVKLTINQVTTPTRNSSQTISGTMDSGATISLVASSAATFGPVTFPTTTTWQCLVSALANGNNTITATATGLASTASTSAIISLVSTPPDLNVSTLADASFTSSQFLNVSGFVQTDNYFDRVTINDLPVDVLNNFFSRTLTLSVGSNTVTVQAFDKAGNEAKDTRIISYDPSRPAVTIATPADGTTVNDTTIALTGTAPIGSTVMLLIYNGSASGAQFSQINQPLNGTAWSTTQSIPLDPGLNTIVAEVTDQNGASSQTKVTVTSDAKVPALAVSTPPRDLSVNKARQTVIGTTTAGATYTATVAGVSVPVVISNGTFSVPVTLTNEGTFPVAITATDQLGNTVTTFRSLVYDVTAPQVTVDPSNPLKVTAKDGTLVARDVNGPVSAVVTFNANGSSTIDLTFSTFDAATLNIQAIDAAGNSSRNGDMNGDSKGDITDGLLALRANVGLDATTPDKLLRADVAPLINGLSTPDGIIDGADVVVILEKIIGLR